jgi:hypothetical protein
MKLTEQQRALVGAIDMLHRIAHGETFTALEYQARLADYKRIAATAVPELEQDAYYGQMFNGYGRHNHAA